MKPPQARLDLHSFETGLLSCVISTDNPVNHSLFFTLFNEKHFSKKNKALYKAIRKSYEFDGKTDAISLWYALDELPDEHKHAEFINLSEVWDYAVTDAYFMHYAKRFYIECKRAEVKALAVELQIDADDVIDLKAVLVDFNENIRKIRFEIDQNKPVDICDSIGQTLSMLEDERSGKIAYIHTGIWDLDDNIGGLRPGNVYVIASRPGVGKSAMAINICNNMANAHQAVLFISLEMLSSEIDKRLLCLRTGIEAYKFQKPKYLKEDDLVKIANEAENIANLPIKYAFKDCNTPDKMESALKQQIDMGNNIRVVIVDHLNLMECENFTDGRRLELTKISRDLKLLSMKYEIPFIELHQLNRGLEHRSDKEKAPTLADLREFGGLEEDASHVCLLWQPDKDIDNLEIVIPKNRHGKKDTITLSFIKEYMLIKSINEEQR